VLARQKVKCKNVSRFKFTKSSLMSLKLPEHGKRKTAYDTEIPKFALRYTSTGSKTFYVVKRSSDMAWIMLGIFPDMTVEQGRLAVEHEMRPLLRDYVEILLYTGIRHGTETLGICWKNIEWHTDKDIRYLRIWVSGKTGGCWLIAKHKAIDALKRLHSRQVELKDIKFDELLKKRVVHKLFTFTGGYQPPSLNGIFRRLMRDSGLEKGENGQNRTLCSLRHTYATLELIEKRTDIHTLSKQMGNSAVMLERHYSKMTVTMAAERLA